MEHGDIMSKTPYELIGQKALYQMIDHFYQLVEKDSRLNHLKRRHMEFTISEYERDAWLENMHTAIQHAELPAGVGDYLFERLRLTAHHMVNS